MASPRARSVTFTFRTVQIVAESMVPMGWSQLDPSHALIGAKAKCIPGTTDRQVANRRSIALDPIHRMTTASSSPAHLPRGGFDEIAAREAMEKLERVTVGDSRQNHGCREEGEEPVRRRTPATSSLAEILQAGESEHALAATL